MAAGRGEFFRSLWAGLERLSPPGGQPPPLGRGRAKPWPERGPAGCRGRWRLPRAASSRVTGSFRREREESFTHDLQEEPPQSREFYLDRLPPEILVKILSFLDSSSLFCVSHVSTLFHQLANDDILWKNIYTSEFRTQNWRPKSAPDVVMKACQKEEEEELGRWKKMYFMALAGLEVTKWRRQLKDVMLHTGLPQHTQRVLRTLKVSWELTLCDGQGHEVVMQESQVHFLDSSVLVSWSDGVFPRLHHIRSLQVHGIRKEVPRSSRVRPSWRSLMVKLDMGTEPQSFIGTDRLIKLVLLSQGVVIGTWRGKNTVAFVILSLHLHRLVEKSLLGSPACLYSDPEEEPPPAFDLQGCSVHLVLHNTATEILSDHFSRVCCRTVRSGRDLLELKVIDRTILHQHRLLSGAVKLLWKSAELGGAVENCCVMTLTVLDGSLNPVWCVSTPVFIRMAKTPSSTTYGGEHFLLDHVSPGEASALVLPSRNFELMFHWKQDV